jgi:hypothetical protein
MEKNTRQPNSNALWKPKTGEILMNEPSKSKRIAIAAECMTALTPILAKYAGMEVVVSFSLPRESAPNTFATCVASNITDHEYAIELLNNSAREIKEQLVVRHGVGHDC